MARAVRHRRGTRPATRRAITHGRAIGALPSCEPIAAGAAEPSAEQLAHEQVLADESLQVLRSPRKARPGGDLLATYMDMLGHIPLFKAEEELRNARHLETLEMDVWRQVLELPRGAAHAYREATALEPPARGRLARLLRAYACAMRCGDALRPSRERASLIAAAARCVRQLDGDREVLDATVRALQRDARCQRVDNVHPAERVSSEHVDAIAAARRVSLRARNNYVRANLRLVISVARKFRHQRLPLLDLIQEGNVGLLKAVHRFDHRRGFRFSTYAHWWIRQSIERAIMNKGSEVRLPVHIVDARRQIHRAKAKLTQSLHREPTTGEIAQSARITKVKVETLLGGVHQDPVSLHEPVSAGDPRQQIDLVADATPDAESHVANAHVRARLHDVLQLLNPLEKDIILRRFGLGTDNDQTLDEIGKIYNLSRERVRQIQALGLSKMRRMCERREITCP